AGGLGPAARAFERQRNRSLLFLAATRFGRGRDLDLRFAAAACASAAFVSAATRLGVSARGRLSSRRRNDWPPDVADNECNERDEGSQAPPKDRKCIRPSSHAGMIIAPTSGMKVAADSQRGRRGRARPEFSLLPSLP